METRYRNAGVTLIELMIALAVVSIISVVIYTVYESQVRGQNAQETALEMQQGLRGALAIMETEFRTAGADPTGRANTGIITARADEFHFTRDVTGAQADGMDNDNDGEVDNPQEARYPDGDTNDGSEEISYRINANNQLGRQTGGSGEHQPLLDNIDALNFVYLDRDGDMLNTPNSLGNVSSANIGRIRTVEVIIVVSEQTQRGLLSRHKDTREYRNQQGDVVFGPANDASRRLSVSTSITCRNL